MKIYLFTFGGGFDIGIMKDSTENSCYCKQESFDYHEITNALTGQDGTNKFSFKRIQVWQMCETEEQKRQREEQERKEKEEKQKKNRDRK